MIASAGMSNSFLAACTLRAATALLFASYCGGCSTPGPYGHSQVYSPLDAEEEATRGSVPFDPSAVRRKPDVWRGRRVATFGVVVEVNAGPVPGTSKVLLSMRGLQPRNLCDGPDDESCRVTVTETEFSQLWAVVPLARVIPSTQPPHPLQPGSLLRVVGKVEPSSNDVDPPTISAELVRHWPLQNYVTTGARESMRR